MKLVKEEIDSIIFDMDGTLWDAMPSYAEVWNVAFAELGMEVRIDHNILRSNIGKTIDEILDSLSLRYEFHVTRDEFLRRVDEIEDALLPTIGGVPYTGMQDGIKKLSKKYPVFLLSNCGKHGLQNFMHYTGIGEYITDYISYGIRQAPKSDNMAFMCKRHGLAHPVYVGDTQGDCSSAHACGIPFVFASYGFGDCKDYDLQIRNFSELVEYFV